MNDESKQRLTRYLGEKWDYPCHNRAFDTWTDLGALMTRIVEKGEWEEFEDYNYRIWNKIPSEYSFTKWLMLDFCELVDGWLEGKEKS